MGLSYADLLVIALYSLLMIVIGWRLKKSISSQEDYFMGGRRFGKLLQVFAMFGSGTSTEEPVGTARNSFTGGLSGIWTALNYLFVTPFYWFIGVWYRRFRYITLGDFFAERYQSRSLAAAYAVFSILFFVAWLSVSFSAASKTITAITPKAESVLSAPEQTELARFRHLRELESRDYSGLSETERVKLQDLRQAAPRGRFSYLSEVQITWFIGLIVLIYSWAGGLKAAYLADFIQGLFIILLSFIMLPFGLWQIAGSHGLGGLLEGFRALHQKVPQEMFDILGSPTAGDFTWYYLCAVTAINLIGIVVMPHLIVVGGGSARDELTARIGIVFGHYIKRFLTILWALAGLIALALYAGQLDDPDLVWGFMARNLLGPVGSGLIGVMICALMAALMSTASCYILCAGSLIVRNLYNLARPGRSEAHYVLAGRLAGALTITGSILFANYYQDVFGQLKFAWEMPVIFASTVWVAMYWRRATTAGAWVSVGFTAFAFFILPAFLPLAVPGLRTDERFLTVTRTEQVVRTYAAREFDVREREKKIEQWESGKSRGAAMGEKPAPLGLGATIEVWSKPPSKAIFWTRGVALEGGILRGEGFFNPDMLLFQWLGLDLESMPNPLVETLRLPLRIFLPLLLMIALSLFTAPVEEEVLRRFYARMKTPVSPDPEKDRQEVERSCREPERFDNQKLFPGTRLEFTRWTRTDLFGFIGSLLCAGLVIATTLFIAGLGRGN